MQWRTLGSISFYDIFPNKSIIEISLVECCVGISQKTNASGDPIFKELSEFALCLLSLPISNAVVERIFSIMNTAKTKIRNRMGQRMLVVLIRIKTHNAEKKVCCSTFVLTNFMLSIFHSEIYNTEKTPKIANFDDSGQSELFDIITVFNASDKSEDYYYY
jgi:hypothetical protein